MGKEYVIIQPIDIGMTEAEVDKMLRAKYALLCLGDTLKREFNRHAMESGVLNIPSKHSTFSAFEQTF